MSPKVATEIIEELKATIERELEERAFLVEDFILAHREQSGVIIDEIIKKEHNLEAKALAILNTQAIPYIPDDYYLPVLLKLLDHPNATLRLKFFIIQKIGWRGKYAAEALPKVEEIFDQNPFLKTIAAISLSEMGYKKMSRVIPVLINTLKLEKDYSIRMNAARQLVLHRDQDSTIVPALIAAMTNDPDFRVRQKIVHYCGENNIQAALETIEQIREQDAHPVVRSVALRVAEKLHSTH